MQNKMQSQAQPIKILAIMGSGRKNGNTSRISQQVHARMVEIAAQKGVAMEWETIYLVDEDIGPCQGCRACMDRGEEKCPLKDNFLAMKGRMQSAHGVLVATPVYVDDVSGLTKNWIDRLGHVSHRPEFAGKCAYSIATSGISPANHTLGTLTQALTTWGFTVAGQRGFITGARMETAEIQARYRREILKVAQSLFKAIYERRFENPSFRSLLTFKIQQRYWQRAGQKSDLQDFIDYRHWKERGWLEPSTTYYIPHRANRLKVALARLIGACIAPFVS